MLVTHEQEVAAYASRTLRMRDGLITEDSAGPRLKPVAPAGDTPDDEAEAEEETA